MERARGRRGLATGAGAATSPRMYSDLGSGSGTDSADDDAAETVRE